MGKEVKVNLDVLDNTYQVYSDSIVQLEGLLLSLNSTMDTLRLQDWRTAGADVFFQTYEDSWKIEFKKHVAYLKHLRDCLLTARIMYHQAYENKF